MTIKVNAMPGCCAIRVLTDFGNGRHSSTHPYLPDQIEKELINIIKMGVANPESSLYATAPASSYGMALVALASEQVAYAQAALDKLGFKLLADRFYHPGHGSYVSLYGRASYDADQKPVPLPQAAQEPISKSIFANKRETPTAYYVTLNNATATATTYDTYAWR